MAFFGNSAFFIDSGVVDGSLNKIATVPAGAYLYKVDVQGYVNLQIATVAFTNGVVPLYNLAGGIQYGAQNYGGLLLSTGGAMGANWFSFADGIRPVLANQNLPGASPQTATQAIGYPLDMHLRRAQYCSIALDIYVAVGIDQSRAYKPFFECCYSYNVEWATYP